MELWGELSNHPWGKRGSKSIAGTYYWNLRERNLLNEDTPYSTLVFSASRSAHPTVIALTKESLSNFIRKNLEVIGKYRKLFRNTLPFQIKIVCLEGCMSLGCHPRKEDAKSLHRKYPGRYATDVHKPKVVLALHYLEVMAGFRPKDEIISCISSIPELGIVIPFKAIEDYICTGEVIHLKGMFYYLMSASKEEIKLSLDIFFSRMSNADSTAKAAVNFSLIKSLFDQFSYDCGVYAPLFLNYMLMNPGQALFIPAGVVHTYLHGDCFEVTTNSRNIVRCGLTSKFKDIDAFLNVADFTPCSKEQLILKPKTVDMYLMKYVPPVKEMQVDRISIPDDLSYTIEEKESCSIAMVRKGTAVLDDFRVISLGTTLFILPYQKLSFRARKDITIYVVTTNPNFIG